VDSRWVDADAPADALERRAYSARLLGAEPSLVLHGGGNTSLKGTAADLFGDERAVLLMKASGRDLAAATAADHVAVDLARARRLLDLPADPWDTDDRALLRALRACLLEPGDPHPSIETPVHAVIPGRFVDHTHADAVLALTNRPDGEAAVRQALGDEVIVVPYASPGLPLARTVARALEEAGFDSEGGDPAGGAMVWMRHGVTTWGETAEGSYRRMIELVGRAEDFLRREAAGGSRSTRPPEAPDPRRLAAVATALRGALAEATGDPDRPWRRVVLRSASDPETLGDLAALDRESAETPPLTADHLIRTGARPLWLEVDADLAGADALRDRIPADPRPRVVLVPGLGAFAAGADARTAGIALDVTRHTLRVKAHLAAAGVTYEGLAPEDLEIQEHRGLQAMKVARGEEPVRSTGMGGTVALVTGAAGAIGAGVCRELLAAGAHVAATDLPGQRLGSLAGDLIRDDDLAVRADRLMTTPMDVTDPASVAAAFDAAASRWGGVDLLVVNAGAAHVATLEELDPADFERLERVNVHGTLLVLSEGARRFRRQGTGGDVVLVSTKNVFAPGASFGAYSATKAAAHQLARVASQELAPLGVRVNMVAPDAVFSDGDRRSGLWADVGPARMRARGLSEEELEEYYRGRNLLQARVTARHVGRAVVFFASRATPTTGATLPVDGGLPDATPR
jgi:rhamnose utilization protein RhaD (predicted bifunctional aldolase and dehydrogenase)/NAD(P)-dependent dehydrogenase (short-subunit alcohol dehydrogenase family)